MEGITSTIMLFVWGFSQSGKSTFINVLNGSDTAATGVDDGESVTVNMNAIEVENPHLLEGKKVVLIDAQGLGDSKLKATDDEISDRITCFALEKIQGNDLRSILVFESLANDTIKLRDTLQKLENAFGSRAKQSVLVLITKSDLITRDRLEKRLPKVKEVCNLFGLKYMLWDNKVNDSEKISGVKLDQQIQELNAKLKQIQPFGLGHLKNIRVEVEERAKELMAHDPGQTKEIEIDKPDAKVEEYIEYVDDFVFEIKELSKSLPGLVGKVLGLFGVKNKTQEITKKPIKRPEKRYKPSITYSKEKKAFIVKYELDYYREKAIEERKKKILSKYQVK